MLRCLLSGALLLLAGAAARANDSLAEVRTGGLVLQRSADIRMVREDLRLSLREVQVTTTFVNEAAKAVTSIVAFPVPEIPAEPEGDIHIDLTQKNPLAFTVTVNGQPQTVKVEQKTDGDMVQLRYYWEQRFSPRQPVVMVHRYQPSWGQSPLPTSIMTPETLPSPLFGTSDVAEYCLDASFLQAADRLARAAIADARDLQIYTMGYVLTTGAHWKGPIGDFRLTVEKPSAQALVSLCMPGIKKRSATTFGIQKTNFRPTQDLRLLFMVER